MSNRAMSNRFVVAVYLEDRSYGGPEEGGWWYNSGELVRELFVVSTEEKAIDLAYRANRLLDATLNKGRRSISSVLSEGRYCAMVWDNWAPEYFPEEVPHYC